MCWETKTEVNWEFDCSSPTPPNLIVHSYSQSLAGSSSTANDCACGSRCFWRARAGQTTEKIILSHIYEIHTSITVFRWWCARMWISTERYIFVVEGGNVVAVVAAKIRRSSCQGNQNYADQRTAESRKKNCAKKWNTFEWLKRWWKAFIGFSFFYFSLNFFLCTILCVLHLPSGLFLSLSKLTAVGSYCPPTNFNGIFVFAWNAFKELRTTGEICGASDWVV